MSNYDLGSEIEEIERLKNQHEMFSSETHQLWDESGIGIGSSILDLGCGPGVTSLELSRRVTSNGKVYALDQDQKYLDHLASGIQTYKSKNIELICQDAVSPFNLDNTLDFVFSRFFLFSISDHEKVFQNIFSSLKKGGKYISYDFTLYHETMRYVPQIKSFDEIIQIPFIGKNEILQRQLDVPLLLEKIGFKILSIQPQIFFSRPGDLKWNWMPLFFKTQREMLLSKDVLSEKHFTDYEKELSKLESTPGSYFISPLFMKMIVEKP